MDVSRGKRPKMGKDGHLRGRADGAKERDRKERDALVHSSCTIGWVVLWVAQSAFPMGGNQPTSHFGPLPSVTLCCSRAKPLFGC
jgi:hypothetical protein